MLLGIGNPGPRYAGTRHNLGFALVARLADVAGVALRPWPGVAARVAPLRLGPRRLLLVEPHTYVNRCGPLTARLLAHLEVAPERLLVATDDLDRGVGALRLRRGGSHGGHNGLRSLEEALGTRAWPRLRLGIGRPAVGVTVTEHVLGTFDPAELAPVDEALGRAAEAVRLWTGWGADRAMEFANRRVRS